MDDPLWRLDSYSLKPLAPPQHHTVEAEELNYQDYSLVITGDVFRWMLNYAPLETLQRVGCESDLLPVPYHDSSDARENANIRKDVSRREKRSG